MSGIGREIGKKLCDAMCHRTSVAIIISGEEDIAALTFEQGGDIGFTVFAGDDDEIAFPVTKDRTVRDIVRACGDPAFSRNGALPWLPAKAGSSAPSCCGEHLKQALERAFIAIDVAIDGFVGDPAERIRHNSQTTGDLFGRPAIVQPFDDVGEECWMALELAETSSSLLGAHVCRYGIVSSMIETMPIAASGMVEVAIDLAVNARAMPA